MKLTEKLLLIFTAVVICAGAICLACNQDIYQEVGNAHPAKGYAEFVTNLSDEEFVLLRYERWESSNSWVLRDLHHFLTTDGAELNTFSLLFTQVVITFAFYYSFACIPFILLTFVRVRQRSKEDGEGDKSTTLRR